MTDQQPVRAPRRPHSMTRRELAWKALGAALLLKAGELHATPNFDNVSSRMPPTPDTGRGPFFPVEDLSGFGNDLVASGGSRLSVASSVQGDPLEIVGRVIGVDGEPAAGAEIVIWQTDAAGLYNHPEATSLLDVEDDAPLDPAFRYFGRAKTASDGGYRFKTIVPGAYSLHGRHRPRHIHLEARHPDYRPVATEIHFTGDPHARADFVTSYAQHLALAVDPEPALDAPAWRRAAFDVVLRPRTAATHLT